ncbi:MAG: VOC family protein [Ignavibacteriaceae bacterium]
MKIISIPVTDSETSKKIYTDKLGFKIVFEGETPEGKWIQLSLPEDNTSISLVSGEQHAPSGSVKGTIISTVNIEKDVEMLRGKGIQIPDVKNFPHGKITSFYDPDGNQWVLREAPKY